MRIIDKGRFITSLIVLVILLGLYIAIGTIERRQENQGYALTETQYTRLYGQAPLEAVCIEGAAIKKETPCI